jgi:drug/metabolite transporter (DMT)-like permease
MSFIGTNQ